MRLRILSLFMVAALLSSGYAVTINRASGMEDSFTAMIGTTPLQFPVSASTNVVISTKPIHSRWTLFSLSQEEYTSNLVLSVEYTNAWGMVAHATNTPDGEYASAIYLRQYGFDLSDEDPPIASATSEYDYLITNNAVHMIGPYGMRTDHSIAKDYIWYTDKYGKAQSKPKYESDFSGNYIKKVGPSQIDYADVTATIRYDDVVQDDGPITLTVHNNWDIYLDPAPTNVLRYRMTGFDPYNTWYMNNHYGYDPTSPSDEWGVTSYTNVIMSLFPSNQNGFAEAWTAAPIPEINFPGLIASNDLADTLAYTIVFTNGAPITLGGGATRYDTDTILLDSTDGTDDTITYSIPAGVTPEGWCIVELGYTNGVSGFVAGGMLQGGPWSSVYLSRIGSSYYTLPWLPCRYYMPCSSNGFTVVTRASAASAARQSRFGVDWVKVYNVDDRRFLFSEMDNSATNYTWNTNCLLSGMDMTPFSVWNSRGDQGSNFRRCAALVTPQHFLTATHYGFQVGDTVRWLTQGNAVIERTVTRAASVAFSDCIHGFPDGTDDCSLYEIDAPVPSSIGHCSVLPTNWVDVCYPLTGLQVACLTQARTFTAATLGVQSSYHYAYDTSRFQLNSEFSGTGNPENDYVPDYYSTHEEHAISNGDSGGAVFFFVRGQAVLLSAFTGEYTGPNYTGLEDEINAQLAAWGTTNRLTEVDLSGL